VFILFAFITESGTVRQKLLVSVSVAWINSWTSR